MVESSIQGIDSCLSLSYQFDNISHCLHTLCVCVCVCVCVVDCREEYDPGITVMKCGVCSFVPTSA